MKVEEINKMNIEKLQEELTSLKKELFTLRVQRSVGQSPKNHLFGKLKKDVARVKTVLRQKVKENE